MEYAISFVLGTLASQLQGGFLKDVPMSETTRRRLRFGVSLWACLICGVAVNYGAFLVDGEFDWESVLTNIGAAFISSQAYYNMHFRTK